MDPGYVDVRSEDAKIDDDEGDAADIQDVYECVKPDCDSILTKKFVCMNVEVLPYAFKEGCRDSMSIRSQRIR